MTHHSYVLRSLQVVVHVRALESGVHLQPGHQVSDLYLTRGHVGQLQGSISLNIIVIVEILQLL